MRLTLRPSIARRVMPDKDLQRLRALRFRAEALSRTLADDLKPFRAEDQKLGFRRTPTSKRDLKVAIDVNVTTTCSCLMALAMCGQLKTFYGDDYKTIVGQVFNNLIEAEWKSSALK